MSKGSKTFEDIEKHSKRMGHGPDFLDGRQRLEDRAYELRYREDGSEIRTLEKVAERLDCSPEQAHTLICAAHQRRQNQKPGTPP